MMGPIQSELLTRQRQGGRGNYQQKCGNVRLAKGSFYHGLKKECHSPDYILLPYLII